MTPPVDVLVPTFGRPAALAVTLTSLASQQARGFRRTRAPSVLYLDDDLVLEPDVVSRLARALALAERLYRVAWVGGVDRRVDAPLALGASGLA